MDSVLVAGEQGWAWMQLAPHTLLGHGPMPELTTLLGSGLSSGQQQPHRMASVVHMDGDQCPSGQRPAPGPGSLGEQV